MAKPNFLKIISQNRVVRNISTFAQENTKSPEEKPSIEAVILRVVSSLWEGRKCFLFLNTQLNFKQKNTVKRDF